ncbi:hypothetical protein ACLX1H_003003 [Fusarium chlamydosporum]
MAPSAKIDDLHKRWECTYCGRKNVINNKECEWCGLRRAKGAKAFTDDDFKIGKLETIFLDDSEHWDYDQNAIAAVKL